jgi:hypothetical protein
MNRSRLLHHLLHRLHRPLHRTPAGSSGTLSNLGARRITNSTEDTVDPPNDPGVPPPLAAQPFAPENYPSLDLAFQQGVRSYAQVAARLTAVHGRIDALQWAVIWLTVAFPIGVRAADRDASLTAGFAIAAFALAGVTVFLGLVTRAWSGMTLVDPARLFENWLHLPEEEFKWRSLYWAGQHFNANSRAVNRKSLLASLMVGLLLVEVGLFIVWLASA